MSIEEYIKIYEELQKYKWIVANIDKDYFFKFVDNLLSDYTRQKQINEEHQKKIGELRERVKELDKENDELLKDLYSANCIIADLTDSIPKQKIKEKIEELKNEKEQLRIDKNVTWDSQIYKLDLKIQVLQELLQEEDK